MKTTAFSLLAALAFGSAAFAAGPKDDYAVTGPVAEVNDSMIVVEKGAKKERFEIARDSSTKTSGDVKVGDKVTVSYKMTATKIEVKPDKAAKKDAKAAASPAASAKK